MSRFALLQELSKQTSSEGRRELLRNVTDALSLGPCASDEEVAELDQMLALVTREFSSQVRKDLARLVAAGGARLSSAAEELALDEISVAEPILRHSPALSESTLLKVVNNTSQQHMMLVSKRHDITHCVSHALVEKGDEHVVSSLLENERAPIAAPTYDAIAERADHHEALQAGLVRRKGVPLDILSGLYLRAEAQLRQEILAKFGAVPESDLNAAFARSRTRVTRTYREVPKDFAATRNRIEELRLQGKLLSPILMTLLREGPGSRTAFEIAFSELAEVDYEVVQRTVEGPDLDALALLCRGAGFERALFVSLAVALDKTEDGLARAIQYGILFESVPPQAAERAMRFWRLRRSAI
jgi:uncharacterized protein (DUF2336 family)